MISAGSASTDRTVSGLRTHIVIPARFASSRYPGKPLVRIKGATGEKRTLIERSWRAASAIPDVEKVFVATDDERIAEEVEAFGGEAVMTPTECRNGTERCAAVCAAPGENPDLVVNFQGDALLTPDWVVTKLIDRMTDGPELEVCTPAVTCNDSLLGSLITDQSAGRVGATTVVFNRGLEALYFSKRVIPYLSPEQVNAQPHMVHLHMGVYAYRPSALATYTATPPSVLEELEGLEQLRFFDAGIKIGVAVCPTPDWDVIELNNPQDLPLIETILGARGIE